MLQMLAALVLLILIAGLLAGTATSLFGYESFVVYSGSMEPAIHVGDLAVVGPAKPEQLMVGDIVTFRTVENPAVLVTHRVVDIGLDDKGQFSFRTKGDANDSVDQVAVAQGSVLGRVVYSVPMLGYLVEFSKRAEGKLLLIGIPGMLLAIDYLVGSRRRRQKSVKPLPGKARELLARARMALSSDASNTALSLCDQALAIDPHSEEAWLLKAECLVDDQERWSCLRTGLTLNPNSALLKKAVELGTASRTAIG